MHINCTDKIDEQGTILSFGYSPTVTLIIGQNLTLWGYCNDLSGL